MGHFTKIIYNWYGELGNFIGEREYYPRDKQDYDRVMEIFEQNPEEYELVNVEYGFGFIEK